MNTASPDTEPEPGTIPTGKLAATAGLCLLVMGTLLGAVALTGNGTAIPGIVSDEGTDSSAETVSLESVSDGRDADTTDTADGETDSSTSAGKSDSSDSGTDSDGDGGADSGDTSPGTDTTNGDGADGETAADTDDESGDTSPDAGDDRTDDSDTGNGSDEAATDTEDTDMPTGPVVDAETDVTIPDEIESGETIEVQFRAEFGDDHVFHGILTRTYVDDGSVDYLYHDSGKPADDSQYGPDAPMVVTYESDPIHAEETKEVEVFVNMQINGGTAIQRTETVTVIGEDDGELDDDPEAAELIEAYYDARGEALIEANEEVAAGHTAAENWHPYWEAHFDSVTDARDAGTEDGLSDGRSYPDGLADDEPESVGDD